ncbi:MAG: flagellar biosynthesis protein FliQ [Firmicutes bacterium]|nr:flagellar biosynthesis protein FliQ [Bacillota bacterium]
MSEELVLNIGREALYTALLVAGPLLLLSLSVGLIVSIFQATTQIQEQTLSFVPKIVAVLLGLALFGPWILQTMREFTIRLVTSIPTVLR